MNQTLTRAADLPATDAATGARVARAQRLRLADEAARLTPAQWLAPTECPRWNVHAMLAHLANAALFTGNPLRFLLDAALGRLRYPGEPSLDAANEVGIDRLRSAPPEQVLATLRRRAEAGRRAPGFLRGFKASDPSLPGYATIGYFVDDILTRDTWLHRHDIARATGSTVEPDPTDAHVVTQVVRDLGLAWTGPDVVLELTGPAGGAWLLGEGSDASAPPVARLDAVEFLRHLSGREVADDLFATVPDAVRPALASARVTF